MVALRRSGATGVERGVNPDFAFAFLDCEFGGLDPELHDITEIAVIVTEATTTTPTRNWSVRSSMTAVLAVPNAGVPNLDHDPMGRE